MKLKKIAGAGLASAAIVAGALFAGAVPANAAGSCGSGQAIGGTPGYVKITCQGSVKVQWRCSLAPTIVSSRTLPYSSTSVTYQFLACDIGYPFNIGWSNV